MLPQTQGARVIYEEHIHPRLAEHEPAIEELIASAHDRLRAAGLAYLQRAVEYLRTHLLGLPPAPAPASSTPPAAHAPHSYTQSLLARFALPSPRWKTPGIGGDAGSGTGTGTTSQGLTTDFYNLLASAVASATRPATAAATISSAPSSSSSLIPDAIRAAGAAARLSFIQAQRERLRVLLSALDREAAAEEAARKQQLQQQQQQQQSENGDEDEGAKSTRSMSGTSEASGLSKRSRSEGDFEKVDVCDDEDEEEDEYEGGVEAGGVAGRDGGRGVRRRGGWESAGEWLSWGWGGGGGGGAGRSSGTDK